MTSKYKYECENCGSKCKYDITYIDSRKDEWSLCCGKCLDDFIGIEYLIKGGEDDN